MAWEHFPVVRGQRLTAAMLNELRYAAAERSIPVPAAIARGAGQSEMAGFLGTLMTNIKNGAGLFGYWQYWNSPSDFQWVYYHGSRATGGGWKNIFEAALGEGVTDWRHSISRGRRISAEALNDIYLVLDKLRIRRRSGVEQPRVHIGRMGTTGWRPLTLAGWTSAKDGAWSIAAMDYGGAYNLPINPGTEWRTWFMRVSIGTTPTPNPTGYYGHANKHLALFTWHHTPPVSSAEDVPDPLVSNLWVNCTIVGNAYSPDSGYIGINRNLVVECRQSSSAPEAYSREWGSLVGSIDYSGQGNLVRVYQIPGGTDQLYFGCTVTTSSEQDLTESGTNLHHIQRQTGYAEEFITTNCWFSEWEMAYVKRTE